MLGHHVKEVMRSLLPLGIDITGLSMDVAVAAYLLDASTGEYELDTLREGGGQLELLSTGEFDPDPADVVLEVARSAAADARVVRERVEENVVILLRFIVKVISAHAEIEWTV